MILILLAEAQKLKTVRLRIFLTSRPEIPIRNGFTDTEYKNYTFYRISPLIINYNISIFLKYELRLIVYSSNWPDTESIKRLVEKSSSLFIWVIIVY
jgi:hypothetical protein